MPVQGNDAAHPTRTRMRRSLAAGGRKWGRGERPRSGAALERASLCPDRRQSASFCSLSVLIRYLLSLSSQAKRYQCLAKICRGDRLTSSGHRRLWFLDIKINIVKEYVT